MAEKGIDFIIKVEDETTPGTYNALAGQRGAKLNRSSDTIDVTTKDSGGWKESEYGIKEWSIESDGLLVEDNEAYLRLETLFMAGTKVLVELETAAGNKYNGTALITDFPTEAPYDDAATYSVTLMGDGALTKTDAG